MLQNQKIKLSNASILLDQEDSHVLDIVLENADDYDFEIENPDQLEYNKANRTIKTKGTLVRGEIYKIKIIPKVQGVRQDVETCLYLQIKGQ